MLGIKGAADWELLVFLQSWGGTDGSVVAIGETLALSREVVSLD
jgi:hypothetical protein